MNSQFNVNDIHSGLLNKCGGKVKSWNKRWFVLREDYCLYYYKDIAKGHLGVITLRDTQFRVRQGEVGDISWPKGTKMECAITMVTTNRTYYMYASSSDEASAWLKILMETKKKLADSLSNRKSLSGSTSSRTTKDETSKDETITSSEHTNGETIAENEGAVVNGDQPVSDSLYDVAKAPEVEDQPTSDQSTPETQPKVNDSEPSALYDEVAFEPSETSPPDNKTEETPPEIKTEVTPPDGTQSQEIYDQIAAEDVESPSVYDQVGPEPTSSIQSQPLPPLPIARTISGVTKDGQPIYEDIPDVAQPLYEPISDSSVEGGGSKMTRETAAEAEDSGGEESTLPPPPLPPKDDDILPPLPPKDSQPPLPPKEDSLPPLPEKNTPPSPRKGTTPPSPRKDTPPSPRKRTTPPSPHRDTPPLPEKDTPPSRHKSLTLPDDSHSPPSPRRRSNSPSSTPPKKPSPVLRRRKVSPAQTDDTAKVEGQDADSSEANKGTGTPGERGMALFRQRGEKVDQLSEAESKRRAESIRTLETVSGDPKLSIHEKATFAETLREVEHERLKASEERFRWERERMKLEEERRKFEEEKRKLQEEIEVTRQQLTQKDT